MSYCSLNFQSKGKAFQNSAFVQSAVCVCVWVSDRVKIKSTYAVYVYIFDFEWSLMEVNNVSEYIAKLIMLSHSICSNSIET